MVANVKNHHEKVIILRLKDLPKLALHEWNTVSQQTAAYLRNLLEQHQQDDTMPCLIIPSVMELAEFFNCSELDILDSFFELRHQAYVYTIPGLTMPISLKDPLCRKPSNERRWHRLSAAFTHFARRSPRPWTEEIQVLQNGP